MNEQQLGRALGICAIVFGPAACGGIAVSSADGHGVGGNGGTGGAGGAIGTGAGAGSGGTGTSTGAAGASSEGLGGSANASGATGGDGGASSGGDGGAVSEDAGASGAVCGNGVTEDGDGCDDGNTDTGDGCSATCTVEEGFACVGAPSACNRSCNGLAKTCGPNADSDCCASSLVPGGTFYRDNDSSYPATVSDFRLDTYEITVGRFRKFMAAYSPHMIAQGAGKNPNNPDDIGWDAANWDASLVADATALEGDLAQTYSTWTSAAGPSTERLPIDYIEWYEAEAFCIWDGGRLPTQAEWNYAAAGGTEQRIYPWGNMPEPAADAELAIYGCYYGSPTGSCSGVSNIAPVGSISAGIGKWGQADLAGNVAEWVQDWEVTPYANPCNNCASLSTAMYRVFRGGGFSGAEGFLRTYSRDYYYPVSRNPFVGARCARNAP